MTQCTARFFSLATLFILSLTVNIAFAHGNDYPMYGGVVKIVGETSFELVVGEDTVELYIIEDGIEIEAATMTAKLMVNTNGERSEFLLEAGEGNMFSASDASIPSGSNVMVLIKNIETLAKIGAKFTVE